jgi:hypothetical protein
MDKEKNKNEYFIHVGKCGGKALWAHILQKAHYKLVHCWYTQRDIENVFSNWETRKYVAVIRNPVERFISAYNWERTYIESPDSFLHNGWDKQVANWSEFYDKYPTLNSLAKDMVDDKIFEVLLASGVKPQQHLYKDIYYYLNPLIKYDEIKDIDLYVLATRSLDDDFKKLAELNPFEYNKLEIINNKMIESGDYDTDLDPKYIPIIEKFYEKDYKVIEWLYANGKIDTAHYDDLMTFKGIQTERDIKNGL